MDNCTVRDGGITCRSGFHRIMQVHNSAGFFQGKFMYEPQSADPYEVMSISGHIYLVNIDAHVVIDLTAAFPANVPQFNPGGDVQAFFVQAEQFLVIQAGDSTTLPFIWDGTTLRRSIGTTDIVAGQPAATYGLTPTDTWVVPPLASTTTLNLPTQYPGIVGNIGVYQVNAGSLPVGTFQVTAFTAIAPFTLTLKTNATNAIGKKILAGFAATFTVGPVPSPPNTSELPAAGAMDYFMGRLWYAQGRQVSAGDIVRGPSGTLAYDFTDSVLKVTENPMVLGGDGFTIPSSDGNVIRAIKHSANIDAALGQGRLFVGTRKAIYAMNVPVTRDEWIAAGNNNQPLMTPVQLANGWVNDRSVVAVNGDLFYQSLEPGIRSLNQSTRFFGQWGNIPISANENRILQYNNRALLRYSSGIYFDNRLLQTQLPVSTAQGVISRALVPMDFLPISSFNKQKEPTWEGMYEGLDIFQLNTGDFGGRERAFATVRSQLDSSIELWEITTGTRFDTIQGEEHRTVWVMEFPAFTWGDETILKRLEGAEIWVDRIYGVVQFTLEYRPDGQACWINWHNWKICNTKNTDESVQNPISYPVQPCLEGYRSTMTLPKPPSDICSTGRPSDLGYQFQPRLVIKGFARIRGLYLHATKVGRQLYANITC